MIWKFFLEPASMRQKRVAFNSLSDVYENCKAENWDGEGALAIPRGAYLEVSRLLENLPLTFPAPEIIADPSGAIGLEWYVGKSRVYVASLFGTGTMTYAGLFGHGRETYGTEPYSTEIPEPMIRHLGQLYDTKSSTRPTRYLSILSVAGCTALVEQPRVRFNDDPCCVVTFDDIKLARVMTDGSVELTLLNEKTIIIRCRQILDSN